MSRRQDPPVAFDFSDAGHDFLVINVGAVAPALQGQYRLILVDTQEQVGEFSVSLETDVDDSSIADHAREYLRSEREDIDMEHRVRVGNRIGLVISRATGDDEFLIEFADRSVERFPRGHIIPNAFTEPAAA